MRRVTCGFAVAKTFGYCWRTLLTVISPALVAQEEASNANGEAHVGARGRSPNLATWRFNWGSPTVSVRLRNTGARVENQG